MRIANFSLMVLCSVMVLLFGCGGGGGGKKGGATDVLTSLGYTGKTTKANITTDNADDYTKSFLDLNKSDYSFPPIQAEVDEDTGIGTGAISGSVTIEEKTDNNGNPTEVTATFNNFDDTNDNQNNPIDGYIKCYFITFDAYGDPDGSGNYTFDFSFKDDYGDTFYFKGSFTLTYPNNNTISFSGVNVKITSTSFPDAAITKDASYTETLGTNKITMNSGGTGISYVATWGWTSWQITEPLVFNLSSKTITSGKTINTGEGNSSMITTFSSTGVKIEIDADGDGTYEGLKNYVWSYF